MTAAHARFAGVVAIHQDRVILVREEHPRWADPCWSIPSGMVESAETPAEGAVRELREETGVDVAAEDLRLGSTSSVIAGGTTILAWNFALEFEEEPVLAVDDPDAAVQEARWVAITDAVEWLRAHPWRPLSEPAIAILTGAAGSGTHWAFAHPQAHPTIAPAARG